MIDEADRILEIGFEEEMRQIIKILPKERQTMLFSATLSQRVLELAYEHMNEPVLVKIESEQVTADRVEQVIYFPAMEEKSGLLVGLLRKFDSGRTIVFVNMKRTAERLEAQLMANGIDAQAMSGDVPQNKRMRMLRDFHEGRLKVLIATDVAARGLHIPDVTHVFNYDLPQDPEDYVHRIGRTARAGAAGDAISFGCEDYVVALPDIEAFIGRKLPVARVEPELVVELVKSDYTPRARPARDSRGRPTRRPDSPRDGNRSNSGSGSRSRRGPDGPNSGSTRGPGADRVNQPGNAQSLPTENPLVAAAVPGVNVEPIEPAKRKRRRRRRSRGPAGSLDNAGTATQEALKAGERRLPMRWMALTGLGLALAALALWRTLNP